jgi:hypothetical protein
MTDIGYTINQAKSQFLDRPKIRRAVGEAMARWAERSGGYVRKTAKNSIRDGKSSAKPGKPPRNWTRLLKDKIVFVWEPQRNNIVVGPTLLNKPDRDALEVLEHGGDAMRRFFIETVESSKRTKSGRVRTKTETRIRFSRKAPLRRVHYAGNPFMGPALDKSQDKLAKFWKDSIRT